MHSFDKQKYEESSKLKLAKFLMVFVAFGVIVGYVCGDRDAFTQIDKSELYNFQGVLSSDIYVFEHPKQEDYAKFELKEFPKHVFKIRGIQLSATQNRKAFEHLIIGDTCYLSTDSINGKYLTATDGPGRYIDIYQFKTAETSFLELGSLNAARANNLSFTSKALIVFFSGVALYLLLDYFGFINRILLWLHLKKGKLKRMFY